MRLLLLLASLSACGGDQTIPADSSASSDTSSDTSGGDTSVDCAETDADGDGANACDDCDDDDAFRSPSAPEACDGLDNDCDGGVDEDWDGDGDGEAGCQADCDDADPRVASILPEICDGLDNDCDGLVDEGFDSDSDGQASCRGDCDDEDPAVMRGMPELCDGIDNDCDPSTSDDGDLDGDGVSRCGGDCDDEDPSNTPDAPEACDGLDNDCDGYVDEVVACLSCVEDGPYAACTPATTWAGAEAFCEALGAQLVVIASDAENDRVAALVGGEAWIGLSDQDAEGAWVWVDGSPFDYAPWYSGEPNNAGEEDCAGTNFGWWGGWNDYNCASNLPFVCESP